MAAAWYLADLGELSGKRAQLGSRAQAQLTTLRKSAMVQSAISSNRIEGVEIAPDRVNSVVLGRPATRDRNEEEVRGYRNALRLIHDKHASLEISEATILNLHKVSRGETWDAGQYKTKDIDIIETYADGRSRVRFRSVSAKATQAAMQELVTLWREQERQANLHPLIAMAALNLDLLCIHPFRDGNGRVSRLLLMLNCYQTGIEIGRYVSFERIIEQNKDRYYETLEASSKGWHEGKHDPWSYINYLLFVLKTASTELGQLIERAGAKPASKPPVKRTKSPKRNARRKPQ